MNLVLAKQVPYGSLLYILLLGVLFYFLLIRPQKKRQEEHINKVQSLKIGDNIVTQSGVRGRIVALDDVSFTIVTGRNDTEIEYLKQALGYIVTPVDGAETHSEEFSGQTEAEKDDDQATEEEE